MYILRYVYIKPKRWQNWYSVPQIMAKIFRNKDVTNLYSNFIIMICITEVLRKYPVLPFLDRVCLENYQIPGSDLILEKGSAVYVPMFGLHYDSNYFPSPNKFNPERFSENCATQIPQGCYIPFGDGPRNCIGKPNTIHSTHQYLGA